MCTVFLHSVGSVGVSSASPESAGGLGGRRVLCEDGAVLEITDSPAGVPGDWSTVSHSSVARRERADAGQFHAATFPDNAVTAVHEAAGDSPGGKAGDEPCLGLNGGPRFRHSEAFSFQVVTDDQDETDRYWNALVGNGGQESACGWCKQRWGLSWQITPRADRRAGHWW